MGRGNPRLANPLQPDLAIQAAIFIPTRIDLHVQEEVHLSFEMLRDCLTRRLANGLQPRPALAQDDRFLAVALNEDLLVDDGRTVLAVFPLLGLDRRRVGQLGLQLQV